MGRHTKQSRWPAGRPSRFTRIRALLAGGLVLGVGAASTLAAWVDNEYARGSFTASVFRTESSVNGGVTWVENDASPGTDLVVSAGGLSPNTVRYTSFWVRTRTGSLSGTGALQAPVITDPDGMASSLLVRVARYTGTTCDASAFAAPAGWIIGPTASAITSAGAGTVPLAANQGSVAQLCFEVTMLGNAPTTLQGKTLIAIWNIQSTSSA